MWKKSLAIALCILFAYPISIHAADEVYIGGDSIGIELQYDGVMITGTYPVTIDNRSYDPIINNIQLGDIIIAVNQVPIHSMSDLYQEFMKYQELSNVIPIRILRNDMQVDVEVKTTYDAQKQSFQSGLYVKDKMSGVGTATFYNPQNKTYGALGHEVMDSDIKKIVSFSSGTIYPADVISITKAQANIAGEKHATIQYSEPLGNVQENTTIGIYGHYDIAGNDTMLLPWATQDEVHVGEATIYTVLSGEKIEPYTIEITKLHKQTSANVKGIEFTINDPKLLAKTNGIIQGMSGSPIVQDGKLIGAITHVITSNPTTGYGVYIEWMMQKANALS